LNRPLTPNEFILYVQTKQWQIICPTNPFFILISNFA
jgi:hypothetical protein